MKTAFLFSGQGSQYTGMGQDIYENFKLAREQFEEASDCLGYDMAALCFEENDRLHLTEYTQPAILTVSTAILRVAQAEGLTAEAVAGLSLGEYTALVASQALTFSQAVQLVAKRGKFMSDCAPEGSGKMVAVMNADPALIEQICRKVATDTGQIVAPANYNTPQQIVIGGETEAVDQAVVQLQEAGVRRCVPLKVSGPFHTPLLKQAASDLKAELARVSFSPMRLPVVGNVTAEVLTDEEVIPLLEKQVMSPVRFYDSIQTLQQLGVTNFIEIGPGKVLSGFMKKIDKTLTTSHIENIPTLNETVANCR